MKVFTINKIRAWDAFTIENEPIKSIDLMNRAARVFSEWFSGQFPDTDHPVFILAGMGNNGGDGVAVARLLHQKFYVAKVFVCDFTGKHSADFEGQIQALPGHGAVELHYLKPGESLPEIPGNAVLIDAMFGSGLTRPLSGHWADLIEQVNGLPNEIVTIDLPSGLFADQHTTGPSIQANRTFSFERPKLAFFFAENADRVGAWDFGSIGLHPKFDEQTDTPFFYLNKSVVKKIFKPRSRFSHKGTYGHALLINGSFGKIGAAVLAGQACLRSGAGLVTLQTPRCGYEILQSQVPEAMCIVDDADHEWAKLPDLGPYTAIGVGCGIGQHPKTAQVLKRLIQKAEKPLMLDADALNLLAKHPDWFAFLPEGTILTPHPKEFERLFGKTGDMFERNALQRAKAEQLKLHIILKGAYTAIACPDGTCWFNETGNPGMATGGSGDVLTGILAGLLAQGYAPQEACLLGVWLHGHAGDLAAKVHGEEALVAGDVVANLSPAWKSIAGC